MLTCTCGSRSLLQQGADAAGELLLDVFGIHVGAHDARIAKAADPPNPLTKPGFIYTIKEIAGRLTKVAQPHEQAALQSALRKLDGRDWYRLDTEQQGRAIEQAMGAILGVHEIVAPKVRDVLQAVGKDVVLGVKQHAAKAWELDITPSFEGVDMKVVNAIASSQAFYIRNQYGQREAALSAVARKVVSDGVKDGLDRNDIGKNLKAALAGTSAERSEAYYRMVASIFAARARSYATLSSFEEAGIESFAIEAAVDEACCAYCRFAHGQTFSVSSAMGTFAKVAESSDPEAVTELQPFAGTMKRDDGGLALFYRKGGERQVIAHVEENAVGEKDKTGAFSHAMSRGHLERAGLTTPPFHPHCRCLGVPADTSFAQVPEDVSAGPTIPAPPPEMERPAAAPTAPPEETFPPANLPENLHELVRPVPAPGRLENPEVAPAPSAEEVAAYQAELAHKKMVKEALAKLAALKPTPDDSGFVEHGLAHQPPDADGDYTFPFTKGPKGEVTGQKLAGAAKQKTKAMPIGSITLVSPDAPEPQIKAAIVSKEPPVAVLVKKGGAYYPASIKDQAIVVGAHLRGQDAVAAKVVDLDKAAAKKPTAAATPTSAGPAAAPPPTPVRPPKPAVSASAPKPMGDATNILHHKDGAATGSNDGGFYTGADGVKRYVKFYNDPRQAHCEHIANQIYAELGFASPDSQLFEHHGKTAYSSVLFDGAKTLRDLGHSKSRSVEILKGFVADVFTANWDAVGVGNAGGDDNILFLKNGRAVRIDNGGALLMRGLGGPKPPAVLNSITEWDKFFDPSINKNYARMAAGAGVYGAADMAEVSAAGIRDVLSLEKRYGTWAAFIEKASPSLDPANKARIAEMLSARSKLLEEKLAELTAPPKPPPAMGAPRFIAKQYSTTLPKAGLRIEKLPETRVIDDFYEKIARYNPDTMPSGEKFAAYRKRAEAAVANIPSASRSAIDDFTGIGYTSIRDSEDRGSPDHRSDAIQKAFKHATAEPGTVFRGIQNVSHEVIQKHLENESFQLGNKGGATSSSTWLIDVAVDSFMDGRDDHHSPAQYKILYVLHGKTQIPVETISASTTEHELLFGRHARFRTVGLSRARGTKRVLIIEAEEIAAPSVDGGAP